MNRYIEEYKSKMTSVEGMANLVETGDYCYVDMAQGAPHIVLNAVADRVRRKEITGIRLYSLLDVAPIDCYRYDLGDGMRGYTGFSGGFARNAVNHGFADVFPCYYRDIPGIIREYGKVNVFFAVVAPMDEHGYMSFGSVASCVEALMEKADRIYLQVNRHMPRAIKGPQIHISKVTALCEMDTPMAKTEPVIIDDTSRTIGNLIADEIPNGSTLQLGIGMIPEAIADALKVKSDLGIHSELLTDGMVDLINSGAVTNEMKPIHKGYTVGTFAVGSQKMYDYIHNNPSLKMIPVDYVNNPSVIAQHPNFMSINSAVEVDFLGQVCAETTGTRHISGTGGQVDFVRGAVLSKGGKSFIAFPSTAKGDTISRITCTLSPGASVTTSKNDVDNIVTEYGIARLRGRTLSQRTKALISIAHPKFREELLYEAKKRNVII